MKKFTILITLVCTLISGSVLSESEGNGGRTSKDVQLVFEGLSEAIFSRFSKELEIAPKLNAKVIFHIRVLNNGDVSKCRGKSKKDNIEVLAADICEIIRNANFGFGKEFELEYPINFQPE